MNVAASPAVPLRRRYAAVAALLAVVSLGMLSARPLFNPDEGRYAEIPREMLAGGDWVIPHLNGLAYIEKPPLQYWATALVYRVLGVGAASARLYTALCALATVAVVWLLARRLWSETVAWRAAAVLASCTLFTVLGQLLTLDMSLTFWMTLAFAGFLAAQQGGADGPRWMRVAWVATAAGVLTKGLVAAAIPAAVLVLHTLVTRDLRPWRRLEPGVGLTLFLAVALPWHWLAAMRMPDFLEFFFIHEHFARYLTPTADRQEAWWFFGVVFLLGSLPWTVAGLRVLGTGWRARAAGGEFNAALFLWLWIVFVIGFFSLSDSKLVPYILPALPALALLVGVSRTDVLRRDLSAAGVVALCCAAALALACMSLARWLPATPRSPCFLQLRLPLLLVAALIAATAVIALRRRGESAAGATEGGLILGAGWCLGLLLTLSAAAAVAPIYSGASLAAAFPPGSGRVPLYSVATYDQTLPFYLGRTVQLVAVRGELDYGLRHDPAYPDLGIAGFRERWAVDEPGYAVMDADLFDELKSQAVPMREVHRDLQRVLVSRQ